MTGLGYHMRYRLAHSPFAKTCDLCPSEGPLTRALLREAYSNARVSVSACTSCAAVAWRTIEQPAPIDVVALDAAVFKPSGYRLVAEWVGAKA